MRPLYAFLTAASLGAALVLGAAPATAHHSFGHYAMDKTTEIEGIVSKWEWGNPHCWLFVDVVQAGKTTTYGFELQSPGELMRRGWKRTSVKVGSKLKVAFRPMKDGTPAGLLARATDSATGQLIGTASGNAGGLPTPPPSKTGT